MQTVFPNDLLIWVFCQLAHYLSTIFFKSKFSLLKIAAIRNALNVLWSLPLGANYNLLVGLPTSDNAVPRLPTYLHAN